MSSTDTHFLWAEFFRNPNEFCDVGKQKKNKKSPDFRHKQTGKLIWMNEYHNPPWVDLMSEGLNLPLPTNKRQTAEFQDQICLVNRVKSCGFEKNISKLRSIHAEIANKSLISKDIHLATALLRTYAKCGALKEAQEVFEEIPVKDVVSWTALIAGYAENGFEHEAMKYYIQMQDKGILPDGVTYVRILKICGILGSLEIGRDIDNKVRKQGLLQKDLVLGNALVDMYAKCGVLEKAQEVFEKLPLRNVVSWTALIAGYAQHGLGHEALKCFRQMKDEGVCPNTVTYVCILKACSTIGAFEVAENIEIEVKKQGLLKKNVVIGSTLVDMYVKFGMLDKARDVFEHLPERNVVTWTTMIAGYAQYGLGHDALKCFREMQDEGVGPNVVTYVCVLKACGIVRSLEIGEEIHIEVKKKGLLQRDITIGNALIDMYAKCGVLTKAQEVFSQLLVKNVVSWTALIAGYVQHGFSGQALECFKQMQDEGISPNVVTYTSILKACGIIGCIDIGKDIDAKVRKQGLLQKDMLLGTTLVDMYAKCDAIENAREVFESLPVRNVMSWNAMIGGYIQHGMCEEARKCFRQMQGDGICPDALTYVCILKSCAVIGALEIGEDIDIEARKQRLLPKDVVLGASLVDMYAKCGALEKAREVFEQLPMRSVVSWTALMAGYADHGLYDEALKCFEQMRVEGVCPDAVTYACILKACSIIGSLTIGEDIDFEVRQNGLLQKDAILGASVVDMYSKCGALEKAWKVFEQLPMRDVVSWCALMGGYGHLGEAKVVLDMFGEMRREGIIPDLVTFRVLLTACSHAGLVREGERLFDDMCVVYCLDPTLEHYTCMIDLFGRAGHFDKVKELLGKVSSSHHLPLFLATLSACHKWMNVTLGKWAFEQSVELDAKCTPAYICMQNIYAATSLQREVDEV